MNFTHLNAVLRSESLSTPQRMIMVVLLNHANDIDHAWPSQVTIARQSGLTDRAVRTNIPLLVDAGWLEVVESHGKTVTYRTVIGDNRKEVPHNRKRVPHYRKQVPGSVVNRKELPGQPEARSAQPEGDSASTGTTFLLSTQDPPKIKSLKQKGEAPPAPPVDKKPKADWRDWNRDHAEKANAVPLPLVPPEFRDCWLAWCKYRTRRACEARIAAEAIQWTEQAAEMSIKGAIAAADKHGWPAVIERFHEAISREWRGPNLTELRAPKPAARQPTTIAKPSDTTNRSAIKV